MIKQGHEPEGSVVEYAIYEIDSNRVLKKRPHTDLTSLAVPGAVPVWIDINRRDPVLLTEVLRSFDVHPLALKSCLETVPNSRIGVYGKSLFIGLPMLLDWADKDRIFLSILCLPGILVTIHEKSVQMLDSIKKDFTSAMQFHAANTSAALYQLLDVIIDREIVLTLEAHERIDRLEEALETESVLDLPDETRSLKHKTVLLEAILEDQHHCVSSLQTIESVAFSVEGIQDYIRDAIAHLDHAVRSVGRQIDRLTSLRQHFLLQLQDKANKRLQILTMVSAIFLPMMLVTGIYGMNFRHMPELSWRYGYPAALLFMGLVAAGFLWVLARKGWFK